MFLSGEFLGFHRVVRLTLLGLLCGATLYADPSERESKNVIEFPLDFNLTLNLKNFSDTKSVQYRIHSFGRTRFVIAAKSIGFISPNHKSNNLIHVSRIEQGQEVFVQKVLPSSEGQDSIGYYEINLPEEGTYLIKPALSHEYWKVQCLSGCGREEISLGKFFKSLSAKEVNTFVQKISSQLHLEGAETKEVKALTRELIQMVAGLNESALSRFPSLPSTVELNLIRSYLAKSVSKQKHKDSQEQLPSHWEEVVGQFEFTTHPKITVLDPELPNIGYGHFISQNIPLKMMSQNLALGAVMTALAERKGYELSFPTAFGQRTVVKNLDEFLSALWQSGHHIELRDERTFANFLSYSYKEKYIRWPIWFNTQIKDNNNEPIYLPAPHSQYTWQVTGPTINGRVNFFLGINGVGFFPKFDEERPQWTGFSNQVQIFDYSEKNKNLIKKATKVAELYLHRVRWEAKEYAKAYPTDGYGYVGICNDSSAVVESALSDVSSFFPLFRSPELLKVPKVNDGLDEVIESLPSDVISLNNPNHRAGDIETLRQRVSGMISYPYDAHFIWDKKFFQQTKELLNH